MVLFTIMYNLLQMKIHKDILFYLDIVRFFFSRENFLTPVIIVVL